MDRKQRPATNVRGCRATRRGGNLGPLRQGRRRIGTLLLNREGRPDLLYRGNQMSANELFSLSIPLLQLYNGGARVGERLFII